MTVRSRICVDLTRFPRIAGDTHARFLNVDGARSARFELLTATAVAPEGTEVVIYVGRLIPVGELDPNEWAGLNSRLRLVFEAWDAETGRRWEAAAAGRSDLDL